MTRSAGYRLQGLGSREENWQSIQGFNATEEVVQAAVCGSPSPCHPELVSGSGFDFISAAAHGYETPYRSTTGWQHGGITG
ncbi:hypothetical protein Y696_03875 [Mesotoga sp. H07pep.5.4]|jgi:hypothetical protein|nr:hypothetical protein Y696_03875 [Mesotoga sp. H07pep.5.4]